MTCSEVSIKIEEKNEQAMMRWFHLFLLLGVKQESKTMFSSKSENSSLFGDHTEADKHDRLLLVTVDEWNEDDVRNWIDLVEYNNDVTDKTWSQWICKIYPAGINGDQLRDLNEVQLKQVGATSEDGVSLFAKCIKDCVTKRTNCIALTNHQNFFTNTRLKAN